MSFIIAQGIGVVALSFSVLTYQLNKRTHMLVSDTTAAFLYALHFFLLGASTGAVLNLIGGLRGVTFYMYPPGKRHRLLLVTFLIIAVVATCIFWDGYISLLALAGSSSYALAFWQTEPKSIRRYLMVSFPTWFVYNAAVRSYPGMAIEVILLISNLTGQYRFDFRKKS